MRLSIVLSFLMGVAALPAIAIAVWLGAYLFRTQYEQKTPAKRITLDLDRPDGMKDYIREWISASAIDDDRLLGVIENEPVTLIVRRNDVACSFETELITVDIDIAKGGRVHRLFISSKGMTLNESVSSTKQILTMLDAEHDKLKKWTKGAVAWSKTRSRGLTIRSRRWMPRIQRS